ncbi:MAG: DedA family protein [Chloroflexi bacterium]|nr:DedA family protein [Chloroflexota bacterium]
MLVVFLIAGAIFFALRFAPGSPAAGALERTGWLTEQGVRLAKDLFESYGYLTVFLAPMLENTIFLGALIPGTLIILLGGLSAHDGLIKFWPALALGVAGAMIGDTISYGMGRFAYGRLGPESRIGHWAEEMREALTKHSVWLVFSYHFFGYSRLIGPAAAGFLRIPFRRWMLLDYTGVTVWVAVYFTLGYLLGVFSLSLDESDKNVRVFEVILFVLFAIAVVGVLRTRARARKQGKEAATAAERAEP